MEKDCTYLLKGRSPSVVLRKALVLFENQITKTDTKRLIIILNQFLALSLHGFVSFRTCSYIFKIITL